MNTKSLIKTMFSTAAVALVGYGAFGFNEAQAYGTGSSGTSSSDVLSYDRIELDYPDGSSREFMFGYMRREPELKYFHGNTQAYEDAMAEFVRVQTDYRDAVIPLLRDYIANVLPQMPQAKQGDFVRFLVNVGGDAGLDDAALALETGFDPAKIAEHRKNREMQNVEWGRELLTNPDLSTDIEWDFFVYLGTEAEIDDINDRLAALQRQYPNENGFWRNAQPLDYSILEDNRRAAAHAIAVGAFSIVENVLTGAQNVHDLGSDQDGVTQLVNALVDPDTITTEDEADVLNREFPQYFEDGLNQLGLSSDAKIAFYNELFKIRAEFDKRPLPGGDAFLRDYAARNSTKIAPQAPALP